MVATMMALEAFTSGARASTNGVVLPFRLAPHHQATLRDVACGVEETNAGVCCRYLLDQISGGSCPETDSDGYIHHLEAVERFIQRYGDFGRSPIVTTWRARIARCRRALAHLRSMGDHKSANVLFIVYGPPDPAAADLVPSFGKELAPLARYTDAVEMKRQELVRSEAINTTARWWVPVTRSESSTPAVDNGQVVDLSRHRARLAWADRAVTSGDALRAALGAFREPPPVPIPGESMLSVEMRREARRDRQRAHEARRDAFILDAKIQARQMLEAAERAYHHAWVQSAVEPDGVISPTSASAPPPSREVSRFDSLPLARVRGSGWSVM